MLGEESRYRRRGAREEKSLHRCGVRALTCIGGPVLGANVSRHDGSPMGRVLAVENQQRFALHGGAEEVRRKQLLVIVVDGTINVAESLVRTGVPFVDQGAKGGCKGFSMVFGITEISFPS